MYRTTSAVDQASSSARYARLEAVVSGKAYHTIQTWMMRTVTWRAVVERGAFTMPVFGKVGWSIESCFAWHTWWERGWLY